MNRIQFFFLFLLASASLRASTRPMFEQALDEGMARAVALGKPVYMNVYAEWAPASVFMREQVFVLQEVSGFYADNFVCVQVDANDSKAQAIIRKYGIVDFPAHLFLDSQGGVLHKALGAMESEDFIRLGQKALIPSLRLSGLSSSFEAGKRTPVFVANYLQELEQAGESTGAVFDEFWLGLKERERFTEEVFTLMDHYLLQLDQPAFAFLMNNRAQYAAKYGNQRVNQKIKSLWQVALMNSLYSEDGEAYLATKQKLMNSGYEYAHELMMLADLEAMAHKQNWSPYAATCEKYVRLYGVEDPVFLNSAAWTMAENATEEKDLRLALGWATKANQQDQGYFVAETMAVLLYKLGDYAEAMNIIRKALALAENQGIEAKHLYALSNRMLAASR